MTFEVGDKVVYPNQGVGTIENISSRSFGAQFEKFYLLRLVYNSMTVMVPFSNVGSIGLRKVTRNAEILARFVINSSVIPSAKYSSAGLPERFLSGNTAMECTGRRGNQRIQSKYLNATTAALTNMKTAAKATSFHRSAVFG